MRNHKGPISRDGECDFARGPADQSCRALHGEDLWGSGRRWVGRGRGLEVGHNAMARMEKVPLFLVICVTAVLIDDHRDVFPTLP